MTREEALPLPEEPRVRRWGRRLVTIPLVFLALVGGILLGGLLPFLIALDRWTGSNLGRTRFLLFGIVYLVLEVGGILTATVLYLSWLVIDGTPEGLARRTYTLQQLWLKTLAGAFFRLYDLELRVVGEDRVPSAGQTGGRPIVVLMRHSSLADTMIPGLILSRQGGYRLRYVLKREMLLDPCFDLAGTWMPNCFVDRGAIDPAVERANIRRIATGLNPDEGVVIYPEGTVFTEIRRSRRAAAEPLARELTRVLPPRPGGTLALLEAVGEARIVVIAHRGLEPAAYPWDLLKGTLTSGCIEVRIEVFETEDLPTSSADRTRWLEDRWRDIDRYLGDMSGT